MKYLQSDNMGRQLEKYVEAINLVKNDSRIESGEVSSDSDEELPKLVSATEALFHLTKLIRFQEQHELILELLVEKTKVQSTFDFY